jgi:hypothetical protein
MRSHAKVHRNVYTRAGSELTARDRAYAAWLWSGRKATLVGHSAAALLGTKWIPADLPAELAHARRGVPNGIAIRSSCIRDDELCVIDGIKCTTAARTAFDLGRRLSQDLAVIRVDALLNKTGIPISAVRSMAQRYPGARDIRGLRAALESADGGAESPQETRLRLLLVRSGFPRPVTQIVVAANQWGRVPRRIDMGWPDKMVGVEYDGELGAPPTRRVGDISPIPTTMRKTLSASNSWPIAAGKSCESALGNSATTKPRLCAA